MRNIFESIREDLDLPSAKARTAGKDANEQATPSRHARAEKRDSPASRVLIDSAAPAKSESKSRNERRRQTRARVNLRVRLRSADAKDRNFEEVLPTQDACRASLYVITENKCYYQRMRLRVAFPFVSAHDSVSTSEDNAEVVRLDPLPDGRTGIVISIKRATGGAQAVAPTYASSARPKPGPERRFAVRRVVSADAAVTDLDSNLRLRGRCSDLSVAGCYIDTMNPFPDGTKLQLQLSDQERTVELTARVITTQLGMGMGLAFDELGLDQTLTLVNWLGSEGETPLPVLEPSAAQDLSGGPKQDLIVKLLYLLYSEGKLTRAQISSLLTDSPSA